MLYSLGEIIRLPSCNNEYPRGYFLGKLQNDLPLLSLTISTRNKNTSNKSYTLK